MWYTHLKTDLGITEVLDLITTGLDDIIEDIAALDLDALFTDLATLDVGEIANLLDTTSTVIGYATSTDGID
jgi:hypothetical protein